MEPAGYLSLFFTALAVLAGAAQPAGDACPPPATVFVEGGSGVCALDAARAAQAAAAGGSALAALCPDAGLDGEAWEQAARALAARLDPRALPARLYLVRGGREALEEARAREARQRRDPCACWVPFEVERADGFVVYEEALRTGCRYNRACQLVPPLLCAEHVSKEEAWTGLSASLALAAYALPVLVLFLFAYLLFHLLAQRPAARRRR